MDAPLYPPSSAYEAPKVVPRLMATRENSIQDFYSNPQAKAILLAEAPGIAAMTSIPMIKPYLGNFSPWTMEMFGVVKPEQLNRVDAQLKAGNIISGGAL